MHTPYENAMDHALMELSRQDLELLCKVQLLENRGLREALETSIGPIATAMTLLVISPEDKTARDIKEQVRKRGLELFNKTIAENN
jgi:hypothetical protein